MYKSSQPLLIQPLTFNDIDGITGNGISSDIDVSIANQITDKPIPDSGRVKRSPYEYGYNYYGPRGYGSGYGYGTRYGGCYNCYRPGRTLARGLFLGGAAFTGGFIGSRLGRGK